MRGSTSRYSRSTARLVNDDQAGAQEHGAHDDRDVEREHGVEGEPAEPRPVEDGLGQHDAVHERGEVEADHGQERQRRVAERVHADQAERADAAGAGGADVVLARAPSWRFVCRRRA